MTDLPRYRLVLAGWPHNLTPLRAGVPKGPYQPRVYTEEEIFGPLRPGRRRLTTEDLFDREELVAHAAEVEAFCRTWNLPYPKTQADCAGKLFRRFLGPSPHRRAARLTMQTLPRWACPLALYAQDHELMQWPDKPMRLDAHWHYDMNHAFASYFRLIPNLAPSQRGHWERVTRFEPDHPFGLYRLAGPEPRARSGFYLARRPQEIAWGCVWKADYSRPSRFREFADYCITYTGPLKEMVKRFPVKLTGKTWSHTITNDGRRRRSLYHPGGFWQPHIWLNVVGGLEADMKTMITDMEVLGTEVEGASHVWVDSFHGKEALAPGFTGTRPGQMRLMDSGWIEYKGGPNRYRTAKMEKHQGVAAANSPALARQKKIQADINEFLREKTWEEIMP